MKALAHLSQAAAAAGVQCPHLAASLIMALYLYDTPTLCLQAACLEARNRDPSAGFNELALSLLDALRALGPAITQGTPPQTRTRLLRALCGVLRHEGGAPLRLRAAATATLGTLAGCAAFAPAFVDALGGARLHCSPCFLSSGLVTSHGEVLSLPPLGGCAAFSELAWYMRDHFPSPRSPLWVIMFCRI